jgi:hypothetical protein
VKELLKNIIGNKYFIVIAAIIIGLLSGRFLFQDNSIEEISEEVIKKETGVNIDLTPATPEEESQNKSSYFPKYMRLH